MMNLCGCVVKIWCGDKLIWLRGGENVGVGAWWSLVVFVVMSLVLCGSVMMVLV